MVLLRIFFRLLSPAYKMTGGKRKLFIGGLPGDCDEKALRNAFANWELEDGELNQFFCANLISYPSSPSDLSCYLKLLSRALFVSKRHCLHEFKLCFTTSNVVYFGITME